jgi:single-stranded-DNA-specific exonuclease
MQEQQLREAIALVEEEQLDNDIIVVSSNNWHLGVVGLIASQLTQTFGRPAMVGVDMPNGETKGSCRSYRDFHILNAMESENVRGLFVKYGGHAMAAGFSIKTDKMPELVANINQYANGQVPEEKARVIEIDAEVMFNEVNNALYLDSKRLEPYGNGHSSPIFGCVEALIHKIDTIGEKHLKLIFKEPNGNQTIQARWWGNGARVSEFPVGSKVTIAFKLEHSDFGGQDFLQMTVEDMKLL